MAPISSDKRTSSQVQQQQLQQQQALESLVQPHLHAPTTLHLKDNAGSLTKDHGGGAVGNGLVGGGGGGGVHSSNSHQHSLANAHSQHSAQHHHHHQHHQHHHQPHQPHHQQHPPKQQQHHHAHHAIKENSSSATPTAANASANNSNTTNTTTTTGRDKQLYHNLHHQLKKGLEILDFHESWLEEMELYKEKVYVNQLQHNKQAFGSHSLNAHNHTHNHTVQLDNHSSASASAESSLSPSPPSSGSAGGGGFLSSKRRPSSDHPANGNNPSTNSAKINNSRVIVRKHTGSYGLTNQASTVTLVAHTINTSASLPAGALIYDAKQCPLKRPRDEANGSATGNNNSSSSNSSSPTKSSNGQSKRHHAHHPHQSRTSKSGSPPLPTAVATAILNNSGSPPTSRSAPKIIVNQFHASSLLSSTHYEDKTKILTQNGLTKTAATAYETSLYASNYVNNNAKNSSQNGAGGGAGGDSDRLYAGGSAPPEDDPCTAIDDVNDYSETDSDEEYTGHPFYLDDDGDQTHQSRNIRYQPDTTSLLSVDSEVSNESTRSEYFRPNSILTPSLFPNVPPYLNFSSHVEKGPPIPQQLHRVLKWKLSPVMPRIVKRVVLNSGFRIIKNTTDWMAIWEKHMKSPGFRTIRSHQKYNHMPGSFRIGRKDSMWRSIYNNVKKYGSKEFGFMQKSYIMPDDLESLRQAWPKNASKLTKWIVKPPASARGTGIRIVNKWSQFPKDRPLVVQKYIERPLLINDNKFDMRIYVVLTSINPLRIYMYKDGLARFASVKYSSELTSLDDRCMHLTNYSINKFSQNYSKNEDFNACQGHKWTLQSLWSCLESRNVNTKRLWATLRNLVIKALISGESGLNRVYRQNVNFRYNCFELFGFDVLLDENLIPWLLEINISPSLHSELPLDLHVKGPLIQAVLNTALYQVPPKLSEKQQEDILDELKLGGPLCHDKRIFTTCLTAEEVRKHNQFTNRSIEFREEYTDAILENMQPDDIRCLIIAEDELARSKPLERIFPTSDTHTYLKFIDNPRYYNRLLDAWENRFGHCREDGIKLLSKYCRDGYHLKVSDAALEKEPNVALTEIDMLHNKKSEEPLNPGLPNNVSTGTSVNTSKSTSPEFTMHALDDSPANAGSAKVISNKEQKQLPTAAGSIPIMLKTN